jgi:hypothetical protein
MSMSIGDAFWIETDSGQWADKVNGKALRLRKTLILEDPDGRELARSMSGSPGSGTRWRSRTPTATGGRW